MEGTIPAEGATANAEALVETPVTAAAEKAPVETLASETAQPSPATTEPDLETLLANPEYRKKFFEHPDIKKELDHRASSEAGRRAKAEIERMQTLDRQRLEAERTKAERERLLQMDEYELGEQRKKELAQQAEEETLQERLRPLYEKTEMAILSRTGTELFDAATEAAKEIGLSEAELDKLDPKSYTSLGAYFKGVTNFLATKHGQKLSKEMAKTEAAAMVEARFAKERDESPAAEVLPPGDSRGLFTRADLANMSPEEYRRNQDRVWEQFTRR